MKRIVSLRGSTVNSSEHPIENERLATDLGECIHGKYHKRDICPDLEGNGHYSPLPSSSQQNPVTSDGNVV